jgi:hypothetical protein
MAQRSLDLIEAMREAAEAAHPITGRGIGYKLFIAGLIPSMARNQMQRVYRLLKEGRERGLIPWEWIVDETRDLERISMWSSPQEFADAVARQYRRDFWDTQPVRVEVWSEKGTVRGVLAPVLNGYGVGFRVMHGFTSATSVHDIAGDCDGRTLIALYVGDYDPSGLYMSEADLPSRLERYDGGHVVLARVALLDHHCRTLPYFPASDKRSDTRYGWFTQRYGDSCWELDALDPNDLRSIVRREITARIEPEAWRRCEVVNRAERESLADVMAAWWRTA